MDRHIRAEWKGARDRERAKNEKIQSVRSAHTFSAHLWQQQIIEMNCIPNL